MQAIQEADVKEEFASTVAPMSAEELETVINALPAGHKWLDDVAKALLLKEDEAKY